MNISLTPELERLVGEKVKSRWYASASEIIRDGLRLLEEQEEIRKTRLEAERGKNRPAESTSWIEVWE
jgi:antitoxin ParD1/3/4